MCNQSHIEVSVGRDASRTAIVDQCDSWVAEHRWFPVNGYAKNTHLGMMHRTLLGLGPWSYKGEHVDHIDGNTLNNCRENLRVVTHAQNMQNRLPHRGSTSKYRGVHWDSRKSRWKVEMCVNKVRYPLGSFTDEEQAADVARAARLRLMPFSNEERMP